MEYARQFVPPTRLHLRSDASSVPFSRSLGQKASKSLSLGASSSSSFGCSSDAKEGLSTPTCKSAPPVQGKSSSVAPQHARGAGWSRSFLR